MTYPNTTKTGIGRPLLVGILLALALVVGLAAWAFTGGTFQRGSADTSDVIVVLVLPDEEGTVIPRTITHVGITGGIESAASVHVDPRTPVTIPGTTYGELRDAYPFGGGSLLAGIFSETTGSANPASGDTRDDNASHPAHVVVDMDALRTLSAGRTASFDLVLPEHMEVFDGERLYTFDEGPVTVTLDELAALFAGAEYLNVGDREEIRVQVAEEILGLLRTGGTPSIDSVETDLSADRYAEFVGE